jgi:hypothetical protein
MNLSQILEGKKVEDFTREALEDLANDNAISFKDNAKDTTIFNKLVKSLSAEQTLKIKILEPVARKYLLSHNVGEEVEIEAKQAQVMVENKDAEFVK